jgi:hypothetical protein
MYDRATINRMIDVHRDLRDFVAQLGEEPIAPPSPLLTRQSDVTPARLKIGLHHLHCMMDSHDRKQRPTPRP